jgi:hypothetical protein
MQLSVQNIKFQQHMTFQTHHIRNYVNFIRTKINNGDLRISTDGLRLEGDLWITRPTIH